jgi:hypothetical protein
MLTTSFYVSSFVIFSQNALKYKKINLNNKFYISIICTIHFLTIIHLLKEYKIITYNLYCYDGCSRLFNSFIMLPSFIIDSSSAFIECLTLLLCCIFVLFFRKPIFWIALLEYSYYILYKIYLLINCIKIK